jgi:hypothetical protein
VAEAGGATPGTPEESLAAGLIPINGDKQKDLLSHSPNTTSGKIWN